MAPLNTYDLKPALVLSETDHKQLTVLALAGLNTSSDAADDLLYEIERARVVPETEFPAEVVRMGTTVTYRPDNGTERSVTLVYPADADISAGKISVLTPIGTALIGLAQGQSITWVARDAKKHALTVLSVKQPS
ncbi:nucleoside diphosphate kinase regulator [Paradevosia shaoguanensis]|jgi:regulator of nucleoside diphosphate kinase|uniref:Nucleoside diphosphate kinase regulator n=1 Tax=Paradevosia shaoguanensis TaxID=1335043 RepID=A0AA41UD38_9HYPH|nr:nucleoside diphosphate kinase regulator [Paradevosia shaoguanensis]KFL26144.1 nucleoside diphosphate kinase regulator [Devosia sp. 17-2-E-8]MBI4048289.1 nucleoside diphosphate kinase regulator [Devosia nanyangense]QMV00684.1 nucleoside diphosphate kinase regulator [Devosia sp. D6-9]CDP51013.1 Regulator of nucleoside diphosphate kinase [Devosia sp. DBB001]MCF1744542.1 nucleoside diphosphate kinase regulator [Paradevosia shaoguanensis]